MRILFAIKSLGHFPYISSVVSELYDTGNEIEILFDKDWSKRESSANIDLFLASRNIEVDWIKKRSGKWRRPILVLRELINCANYAKQDCYSNHYKRRWFGYIPLILRPIANLMRFFNGKLGKIESFIPPSSEATDDLADRMPDVVIGTPCNHRFSEEVEYIKAAKQLGIPTAIIVLSYDNLTTKGLFQVKPDKLLVWNKSQAITANVIHRIADDRIEIIGSPFFSKWSSSEYRWHNSRESFCAKVGIDDSKPFCLYLGSSANIIEDETWILKRLAAEFKDVTFLVRPHPSNYKNYLWLKEKNIVVYPRNGELSSKDESKTDFHNSLKHCAFAFGINTSAMIDAIIKDVPVVTLTDVSYEDTQLKTEHFWNMYKAVYVTMSFDELITMVMWLLDGNDVKVNNRKEFVSEFIYPKEAVRVENALIGIGNSVDESNHNWRLRFHRTSFS